MLTPNPNTQNKCRKENLPATFLQVRYAFALQFPPTFLFFSFFKNWFLIVDPGFKLLAIRDINSFIYPKKTMTA
jgi:hypothetical protein